MKNFPMILGIEAQRRQNKKNNESFLMFGQTQSQRPSSSNPNNKSKAR